jgi:hypothetical protein
MPDKDPWCCASDKLRINIDGFDAGYINALRSVRYLVRALPKDEALAVLDELVAEFKPFHERQAEADIAPLAQHHRRNR